MPNRRCPAALLAAAFGALAGCDYASFSFHSDPTVGQLEFTRQPQSTTVLVGQSARFVAAAAGGGEIRFQWQRNGLTVAGATASAYTTPPTTLADDGTLITVRACNELACVDSLPALLTVLRSQ
jgi:hypothetical protein